MNIDKNSLVIIQDIRKTYKSKAETNEVLKDVSLEVHASEFVIIMGPSGSGKSTLLNIIGMLDKPTSGHIGYKWTGFNSPDEKELSYLRGKNIGFIFQNFNLMPNFTVYENVALPLYINKEVKPGNRKNIARNCLTMVGLESKLEQCANTLSGGEQQRVAIARSIINNPSLILADEPTANVDGENEKKIIDIFLNIVKQGKSVVVVTHNEVYKKYADRIFYLENGNLIGRENEKQGLFNNWAE